MNSSIVSIQPPKTMATVKHTAKTHIVRCRSTFWHLGSIAFLVALIAIASEPILAQDDAGVPSAAQTDTTRASCLIHNPFNIAEADAQTSALLVCQALRSRGIDVGEPVYEVPDTANVYRVGVHFLGEAVLLRVSHEVPVGTIIRERQVRLASIEEAFDAAGRLALALESEETVESTATMETLITEDLVAEISLWEFGLVAAVAPGENATPAPGFLLGWHYETPRFGIFADFLFANNDNDENRFQYGTITVGGRYFLTDKAIAPWISGGASMLFGTRSNEFEQEGSGIGVFGAVGLEVLRFNRNRLAVELRLSLPFSKLSHDEYDPFFDFENGEPVVSDRYVAPISLSIAYLRDAPWLSWW
ncbi:MAG: hypothetical protein F4Y61_05790 [Rhodothermaceae bacterium]|nr:hypothetical protein [Rhodothermaceae bacterium]